MWLKLLLAVGAGAFGYAAYSSKAAENAKAATMKGAADPNYEPNGVVFAADGRWSGQRGPIGAALIPRTPPTNQMLVNGEYVYGPSGRVGQTCGAPSGVSSGCLPVRQQPITLSPTFWAADKVPTNPALQVDTNSIDANPYLDYPLGRTSPMGTPPPVPVNHT